MSIGAVLAPILATRWLPFTDAPEHAAAMATLRYVRDPLFSGPYELALHRSPYLLYHLTGAALTLLVGDAALANRLLIAAVGVALPFSFRALLRATARDDRLAIFACLPFWSRALVTGFLPFVASIPLVFWALAHVFRAVRSRARRSLVGLAVLATLLFFTHVSAWLVFVSSAVAVAAFAWRPRVLAALAPSALAAAAWVATGAWSFGERSAGLAEVRRLGVGRSLLALPTWVFDAWQSRGDDFAGAAWWTGMLAVVVFGARSISRTPRRLVVMLYLPFACALFLYLATPWRVGVAAMLDVRLAPFLVLFAFLPMRLPRRGRLADIPIALALIANVTGGAAALRACLDARKELGDLDRVLSVMPPGARLLTLNFDPSTRVTHLFPWGHVGAYHRVRRGGVASYSFSELEHWPVRYAASERPPIKQGATWDIDPCTFRNAVDGAYYDFVLVRGEVNPFEREPSGPVFRPVVSAPPMTLYRKDRGTWRARRDEGPCAGRSSR